MPSIHGKVIHRRIVIDVGLQPALPPQQPHPPIHSCTGLVDTGAQMTCITRSIAQRIGLTPRGKIPVGGVGGIAHHMSYAFTLGIWVKFAADTDVDPTTSYFCFEPVLGADFADNGDFDVLIGMDIIGQGDLPIRRDGRFSFSVG